jgi:hypothetical protein
MRRIIESHFANIERFRAFTLRALGPDLQPEHLCYRISGKHSHILWLAGHLANTEDRLVNFLMFGNPVLPPDFPRLFANGTQPQDAGAYPAFGEILAAFSRAHEAAKANLATITDEALDRALPADLPVSKVFPTVGDALRAVAPHEAYHTGQITILRTVQGLPPMAPA